MPSYNIYYSSIVQATRSDGSTLALYGSFGFATVANLPANKPLKEKKILPHLSPSLSSLAQL